MNNLQTKDLIILALDTFIENDSPLLIDKGEDFVYFETVLGELGRIQKNQNSDWDIYLANEFVYSIEKQVFEILYSSENAPNINDYTTRVKEVYNTNLQEKSKIFVGWIVEGIVKMARSGKVEIEQDIQYGPFVFLKNKNIGNQNIILN